MHFFEKKCLKSLVGKNKPATFAPAFRKGHDVNLEDKPSSLKWFPYRQSSTRAGAVLLSWHVRLGKRYEPSRSEDREGSIASQGRRQDRSPAIGMCVSVKIQSRNTLESLILAQDER